MKKRRYLMLIATAIIVLASCSSEEFVGEESTTPTQNNEPSLISFGSNFKAVTRADITGADAAALLNKRFIVSGYKGKQSDYVTLAGDDQSAIVFDNYQVLWTENSAHTTESNVANWEYANIEKYFTSAANLQTVKYWDNNYPQYDFIAYSLGNKEPAKSAGDWDQWGNPTAGKIGVTAIDPSNLTNAAYSLTGSATDLASCYIADLVTMKRDDYGDFPVTIRFRNLSSKVRIALYETVPGYSVKDVQFYGAATGGTPTANATLFGAENYFCTLGTYTIYYPTLDSPNDKDNNKAHVKYSGEGNAAGSFGAFPQEEIGTNSLTATYAGDYSSNYYTAVLPKEDGGTLNLRVNYTLESTDGMHEQIRVYGATAQVPALYAMWQAGYAYTYIFKISDRTNGYTDPNGIYPEGLYPITFDAVVVDDVTEDGTVQETITTVSAPSITTYQAGTSTVDEYFSGKAIYAVVGEEAALATLTNKAALYVIPDGKTEAEIGDALQIREDVLPDGAAEGAILGRNGILLTPAEFSLTNKITTTDGAVLTVGDNKAATFTPAAPVAPATMTTYAFVYTQQAAFGAPTEKYEVKTFAEGASVKNYYCDYRYEDRTGEDAREGDQYYTKSDGEVFTPLAVPAPDLYYGQSVNGLKIKENDHIYNTYGKARTGITYVDATGQPIISVTYAAFATTTLYKQVGGDYTQSTDAAPTDDIYYQRTGGAGTAANPYTYTRCVILPQQINGYYIRHDFMPGAYIKCPDGEKAILGKTYYDRYLINNGLYAVKVIKVK